VVFDFEMTRGKTVATEFFKDYGGILHTGGYVVYEKDIGTKDLIHACCLAHARRGFIDAIKVQTKAQSPDTQLEHIIALMDDLFAIDRKAREQNLSLTDRHALRQELAPRCSASFMPGCLRCNHRAPSCRSRLPARPSTTR
jgi:hypothetical protein